MLYRKSLLFSPGRLIVLTIAATIIVGAWLLNLTCAQQQPVAFIDSLFTATSATCVTGLQVVPLNKFTVFGQCVILGLIQIGGLGLITLTIFLMSFFIELGLSTQFMAGQMYELEHWGSTRRLISFIVILTLISEAVGSLLIWYTLPDTFTGAHRIFCSLFHAVASFCNAGFTLIPGGIPALRNYPFFLLVTTVLIALGGFGFFSIRELMRAIISRIQKHHMPRLSLQTRLVISTTLGITLFAALMIWILEYKELFKQMPFFTSLSNVIFDALCLRSTGFTTLDIASIRLPTLFIIMVIAFIGSSPGSTGSGIKTTTFAIFLATIKSVIKGRLSVEVKGRRIPNEQVFKAMAVFSLSLSWIGMGIFILLVTEEGWQFIDVMFEVFSAFTNVGLSTGITPYLSYYGKWLIMLMMIIGRIGSLTLLIALKRRRQELIDVRYPEERIALS